MEKFGYARVSTTDQNIDLQVEALKQAGVKPENIYTDIGVSGKRAKRPALDQMLNKLRKGDEVIVWRLDRLGRSMIHVAQLGEQFKEQGIGFKSLNDGVDTNTTTGRLLFNLLTSIAEYEREMIIERTTAGLATARAQGRTGGRPKAMTPKLARHIEALVNSGHKATEIAEALGVSRATAYRYLDTYETELCPPPQTQESPRPPQWRPGANPFNQRARRISS
ncbi:recombinase family protein [Brevibacterium luteolum]|uniref:recombinase family protein n=1 Tax=Brevibacterium luteolum TaxID=199591 RepID=UPI00223A7DCB|nr:recombinase family protein [Brevibacterium luteolum]MCT1658207.1 recombinase family protein [Brevibacterium luteolum]